MGILYKQMIFAGFLLTSFGMTTVMNRYMQRRNFKANPSLNCTISIIITAMLYIVGGLSMWTVKGIVMSLILLYASVQDISTREADDFLWVMLLMLSLINFGDISIWSMILGGLIVFIPQMLIATLSKKGSIGGADIKISSAAAVSLGFYGGVIGYMLGLVFAVIFQTTHNRAKKQSNKEPFPLLPFLSTGLMIGYFI